MASRNQERRLTAFFDLYEYCMMSPEMKDAHKCTVEAATIFAACPFCKSSPPGNLHCICDAGHIGCSECPVKLGLAVSACLMGRRGTCPVGGCSKKHLHAPVPIPDLDKLCKSSMAAVEALTFALKTDDARNRQSEIDLEIGPGDVDADQSILQDEENGLGCQDGHVEEPNEEMQPNDQPGDVFETEVVQEPPLGKGGEGDGDFSSGDENEMNDKMSERKKLNADKAKAKRHDNKRKLGEYAEMQEYMRINKPKLERFEQLENYVKSLGGSEQGFEAFTQMQDVHGV